MIQVCICILRVTQLQMSLGIRDIQSWIGDGLGVLSSHVVLGSAPHQSCRQEEALT